MIHNYISVLTVSRNRFCFQFYLGEERKLVVVILFLYKDLLMTMGMEQLCPPLLTVIDNQKDHENLGNFIQVSEFSLTPKEVLQN